MEMSKNLTFFACKLEAENGVAEYVNPAADISYVTEGSVEINQIVEKLDIASGSFTTEKQIMGNANANVKVKIPLCSHSTTEEPDIGKYLECHAFFKSTQAAGAVTKFIYERGDITTSKSMSVIDVARNSSGNDARIKSAHGVMYQTLKIALDSGKVSIADFAGIGMIGGKSAGGAAVDAESTQTIVKPSKLVREGYTVNSCDCVFGTTGYELVKLSIDLTNKIQQKPVMTGNGFGPSTLVSEESKFTCSTLLNTAMLNQPYKQMRLGEILNVAIEFGQIQNRRIKIEFQAQITGAKDTPQGDLLGSDISGEIVDNKIKITFNADAVAA